MSFSNPKCQPGFGSVVISSVFYLGLILVQPEVARADVLVEEGQRALLTYTVKVEGSVVAPQAQRDEVVKWSTLRSFEATVEVEAEKPEQLSYNANASNEPNAMPQVYTDLAKQVEACGDDQACVMRVAMQMAGSSELKEAKDMPPRYQIWRAPSKGGRVEAKASYEDKWYTLFYVSGPEITDCTLTAPKVSSELTKMEGNSLAALEQQSKQTQLDTAQAVYVEIDAEKQSGKLTVMALGAGFGDEKCTLTLGGNPETLHRSTNVTVVPAGDEKGPLHIDGKATGTTVIASGSGKIDTKLALTQLGAAFAVDVSVPLQITVSWELKAL